MIGVQINHINGKIMALTLLYHLLSNSIFSKQFDEKYFWVRKIELPFFWRDFSHCTWSQIKERFPQIRIVLINRWGIQFDDFNFKISNKSFDVKKSRQNIDEIFKVQDDYAFTVSTKLNRTWYYIERYREKGKHRL